MGLLRGWIVLRDYDHDSKGDESFDLGETVEEICSHVEAISARRVARVCRLDHNGCSSLHLFSASNHRDHEEDASREIIDYLKKRDPHGAFIKAQLMLTDAEFPEFRWIGSVGTPDEPFE